MAGEPFIQCSNLIKIYQINDLNKTSDSSLEVQALQGLDLTVSEGEMIGIVGASGSGKSTLLNILGGLDRPNGGKVTVNKMDLSKLNQKALDQYRRKIVGFVWQYGARNLIPYLTAEENIQLPMTLIGSVGKTPHERSLELLEQIKLSDRKDHRLEELSGGEQQRVAVAIAIANTPKLLLADEPTGELDTATAKTIYDLFRDLNQKLGLTIVIVSHDPGIAQHVDRVVAVRDGKLASESIRRIAISKETGEKAKEDHTQIFEELAILDSAGRISIPREYLDHFQIRRRVRMEVTQQGILIMPPNEREKDGHDYAVQTSDDEYKVPEDYEKIVAWARRIKKIYHGFGKIFGKQENPGEKSQTKSVQKGGDKE